MSSMHGKTVVVTGATAGIGRVVCERLAAMNATLALVARDRARAEVLAKELARAGAPHVTVHIADLSRLAEVRRITAELAALPRIDVLLNNAGAIFNQRQQTADSFERTFALNHLAYFALTDLLLARLRASAPARIVNVASEAHRGATLAFDDLQTARGYSGWLAYRRSKLCNILFTRALARRLAGTGVTTNALHPGFVATDFGNNNGGVFRFGLGIAKQFMAIPPADGAKTPVYLASAPEVANLSGLYFDKCAVREPSPEAQNDESAERLWRDSARMTGLA
ncbi:MAG TPA: SDR family oxidoreductase [Stellaceae bacterium]|nr:SDR family oxidoreductase [Stellaceae bacterium]